MLMKNGVMSMDKMILSLDLSLSSTGFSVLKNNEIIYYGKICTKPKDFNKSDEKRMFYISNIITQIAKEYKVKYIAIENTYTGINPKTSTILAKLCGFVCKGLMDYDENILIGIYMPTSIRKGVVGVGNATKERVADYIRSHYIDIGEYSDKQSKENEKTSDIYDAIAVGIYMYKKYNGEIK